eukprot:6824360-Prymnesium_polylepis.1
MWRAPCGWCRVNACESGCDGSRGQTNWTVCGPICTAECVKRWCIMLIGSRVTRACGLDCVQYFIDMISAEAYRVRFFAA